MTKRALEPMKIPVTILTGFLGSGKTTLLNHLLTENHGKKFAIIENEVGEVGVDDQFLRTAVEAASAAAPASDSGKGSRVPKFEASEQILTMNNGCICCTVRGDLMRMIHHILRRVGDRGPLDGIIIETTGMADPSPVVQTFFVEPSIARTCKLDGIITVVDAKHILQHLEPGCGVERECEEQIAFADRLLLNKTDLVSPDELETIREQIRDINGTVSIIECQQCRVEPELLLNVQTFDLDSILTKRPDFLSESAKEKDEAHGHHDNEHGKDSHGSPSSVENENVHGHSGTQESHQESHTHHHHEQKHGVGSLVSSVGMTSTEPTVLAILEDWIADLLEEHGDDLLWYKGVISVAGVDRKYVFQGVHTLFYGRFSDPWSPNEKRESRFVFIGKNLD
jgi:G3E family GTPase